MDGGDGWHVTSCTQSSQRMIIDRVMTLRFRPIAPKPTAGGALPGGMSPEKQTVLPLGKRVKRKYVRVKKDDKNPRARGKNRSSDKNEKSELCSTTDQATTLQLMPEKSDGYVSPGGGSWYVIGSRESKTSVLENRDPPAVNVAGETPDRAVVGPPWSGRGLVESWVTVESVADMCMDVRGLGCTDVERIKNLERDACPGFVSDGLLSKVQWVNEAYLRMVAAAEASHLDHGGERRPEVAVWLVSKANDNNNKNNNNNYYNYKLRCTDVAGFTCRVRVQYMRNMKEKCWKIMPCDVWRLDRGGFAWRLDVKAALSLGL